MLLSTMVYVAYTLWAFSICEDTLWMLNEGAYAVSLHGRKVEGG